MSCVRCSMRVLNSVQCTVVLPEEGLGSGLVAPFLAYRFAALVSNNEDLNSPKQSKRCLLLAGQGMKETAGDTRNRTPWVLAALGELRGAEDTGK